MDTMMIATICSLGLALTACQKAEDSPSTNGEETMYTMPAESSPHEGTWLQWPQKHQYGETYRNRLETTWIAMARQIVSGENLHIIAYNEEAKERIISQLTEANIPQERIDFYLFKTNDVWVRDNGPIYVRDKSGTLTIEGWGFNGWGDKEPFNYDNIIPDEVAVAEKMSFVQLNKKMILEGGAVELDGKGSLMATRSAVLNKNRNPGMTQGQAEALFANYLGATHFIWLEGVAGQPYNYVVLPLTQNNVITTYGKDLGYQGSYVNYYITNDKVLVPNYNDPNDPKANALVQTLYPDRKVVGIDVRNLYANGGMVHCVTQQQPR